VIIAGTVLIGWVLIAGTEGGVAASHRDGRAAGKFRLLDFTLDFQKPVFWVVLIGGFVAKLGVVYQRPSCVVQRYLTTHDEKGAARSILFNGVLSFVNCAVFFLIGSACHVLSFASRMARCDDAQETIRSFPTFM
jgi:Na+/proline symporter